MHGESLFRAMVASCALIATSCSREERRSAYITNPRVVRSILPPTAYTDHLLGSIPLKNTYESREPIFPYYDTSLADQANGFESEYRFVDLAAGDLTPATGNRLFRYFSGNIMDDAFTDLRSHIELRRQVYELIPDESIRQKITANLWLGGKDVVAPAHYDAVYNVYLQFAGSKTFRLLPPSAVHHLRVHGRMHPYACQSRFRNISTGEVFARAPFCIAEPCGFPTAAPPAAGYTTQSTEPAYKEWSSTIDTTVGGILSQDAYSGYYAQNALEITLQAGDALVIPPFWFHEVQAHSAALAVSLWWDTAELDVMDKIYALPLPFESDWDERTLVRHAGCFASALISATVTNIEKAVPEELSQYWTGALLSTAEVKRLLIIRYSDDVVYAKPQHYGDGTSSSVSSAQDGNSAGGPDRRCSDMTEVVRRHAILFSSEFLKIENFATGDSLPAFQASPQPCAGDKTPQNTCDNAGAGDTMQVVYEDVRVVKNQLAVLAIKLGDFVEDVFRHVSEMLGDGKAPGKFMRDDGGSKSFNAVAVGLLVEWLILIDK